MVIVILFYNKFTVTVGDGFILVPEALIDVIVVFKITLDGKIIYSHPVDDNRSLRLIENT